MNTPLPRQWWIILLSVCIVLNIFVIVRVAFGHSPIAALFMSLASTLFVASQLHRRAIIFWWALAFALLTVGLVITLLSSR